MVRVKEPTVRENNDGTAGGYGNIGQKAGHTTATYGNIYGDYFLDDLLGGSGGGGGQYQGGGSGGGAIELIAHGTGVLKLDSGARITVNGGDTASNNRGGGGGSGGSIRLAGGSIENNGQLEARGGGLEPGGIADFDGSGGRIAFDSNGTIKVGSYDVTGHSILNRHDYSVYPNYDGTLSLRGDSGVNNLSYASGTLTIDTSVGYWYHSGGDHGQGVIQSHDDGGVEYKTCTFTFDSISLTGSLNVVLQGDNSLVMKTQSNGSVTWELILMRMEVLQIMIQVG